MRAPAIEWTWVRWPELSRDDLYDALQLRACVFILEQGPYLDPDGLDRHSSHLLGRLAEPWPCDAADATGSNTPTQYAPLRTGELVLYLRVVDAGHKYAEPSLGRVVSHAALRGQGLGRQLIAQALAHCDAVAWPNQANRISAQAHLAGFYAEFGYQPVGDAYSEDHIPHLEMLRPAQLA